MKKSLLGALLVLLLNPLCFGQNLADDLIFKDQWRKYPFDNKAFQLTRKSLKKNWQSFHRATDYPFPNVIYISNLLKENQPLKASIPTDMPLKQVVNTLQDAWIAFFAGDFQHATQLGYSLGPIGHGVAFYSQTTYASRLEPDTDKRHALWEDVLKRHEASKKITRYDSMTRFFAFFSMARLSEEISAPIVLARNYVGKMQQALIELNVDDPHNVFVLAAQGSMDAGIVRKLGKLMGQLTYGASPETVEEYYQKVTALDKKIPNVQLEYAQSLLYMYGKKQLKRALIHMRKASEVQPAFAMETLDVLQAKKLLLELTKIDNKNGYGLRAYVKRNTDMEKKYYF